MNNQKKKIGIIEDDTSISEGIELILGTEKYEFRHFFCLNEVEDPEKLDLIILDINLPDGSGFEFLKEFRKNYSTPVLILTANNTEMDEVTGFRLGADDYVTKPFSLMVLRMRIQKLLGKDIVSFTIERDGLYLDFSNLIFRKNGSEIELSKTEVKVLRYMTDNAGITLSRDRMIEQIWQDQDYVDNNALSVTIKRLRDKLEDDEYRFIRTVYGLGYVWEWRK